MSNKLMEFAYIHVHTRYSIKDSFVDAADYMKKIRAYNESKDRQYQIVGLSVTEHGNMHSLVKHYNAAKEPDKLGYRVNPIYGCEVYHTDSRDVNPDKRYHLVLLAKNQKGLENLYQLVSDAGVHSIKSRVGNMFALSQEAAFKEFGEGIIATSACLGGIIPKLLLGEEVKVDKNTKVQIPPDYEKAKQKALEYQSYFDEFYLEVQPHRIPEQLLLNAELVRLSQDTGIPLVMGVDAHYVNSEDKQYHDILKDIAKYPRYDTNNYLFSPEEIYDFCIEHDIPLEAMWNTAKISNQCLVDPKPKNSRGLLPEFPVPIGYSEDGYLRELCNKALIERITRNKILNVQTYIERLNYELEVICGAGFAGYFLILWDWFKWCRQNDILMGKGRGSAAGSLVSYTLDITTLDPIKNGLIFERFLSPERLEFPDVDSDVDSTKRADAIRYLLQRYGEEHVAQIITFGEFKLKNTLKAVNTAYGYMSNEEINAITTKIPSFIDGKDATWDLICNVADNPEDHHELSAADVSLCMSIRAQLEGLFVKYPLMHDAIIHLRGAIASAGVHAGGVIISGKPLNKNLPVTLAKGNAAVLPVIQFEMGDLDFFKALKIDVLGLQTCSIIHRAMKLAGLGFDWYDSEDFEDEAVYEMLRMGQTTDVFQMAKHTPRQMIKDFFCNSLAILTAINAGNRPGPLAKIEDLGKSMVELFGERVKNPALIPKIHDQIDEILKETYGCLWYQEQCQFLGQLMAGYTLGGADSRIRKILAKKKAKDIPELRNEFIYGKKSIRDEEGHVIGISEEDSDWCIGCVRNGFSEELAVEIFNVMEKFSKYAFNKSHSAAYAAIAYKTAWLSYYYPVEYAVACMSEYDDKDKILSTLAMCRKRGIKILPPDINKSAIGFTVEVLPDGEKAIRFGLAAIHNVGPKAVDFLLHVRNVVGEVQSLDDYYTKFHDKSITTPILLEMQSPQDRAENKRVQNPLNKGIEEALILSGCFDEFEKNRYLLYNNYRGVIRKETKFKAYDENDYKRKAKLALEKEYMGTYISEHPLEPFPYTNLDQAEDNQYVEISGIVLSKEKKRGARAEYYQIRFEAKDGTIIRANMFGQVVNKYKNLIVKDGMYVFGGRYNEQYKNIGISSVKEIVSKGQSQPNPTAEDVTEILVGDETVPVRKDPFSDLSFDDIFGS